VLFLKNLKNKKKIAIFILDLLYVPAASFFSHFVCLSTRGYPLKSWVADQRFMYFTFIMIALYALLLYIFQLYDIPKKFRKVFTLSRILTASFLSCALFLIVSRVFTVIIFSKYILLLFIGILTLCLFLHRLLILQYMIFSKQRKSNLLFIGTDILTKEIIAYIKNSEYEVVGILSNDESAIGTVKNGLKVVSTGKNLGNLIISKKIQTVILSLQNPISLDTIKKVYKYQFKGIDVFRSDYFYEVLTRKFPIEQYVSDKTIPFPNIDTFTSSIFKNTKRLIDLCGAFIALVATIPLFLFIAMVIKFTSKGPIFYLQQRVGFQEIPFQLIKFRTMIADAEKEKGPQWAKKEDKRVTTIGLFLRKTRLDELPQLINVIKGDLSFVGPRPIRKHFVDIIENEIPFYSIRFLIKPGVTGWAQVNFHYGGSIEGHIEKFQYDLYYLEHASLFLDFFIILKTLQTIVKRPAY